MWGSNILHAQQSLQDTLSHLTWNDVSEITMRHHRDILIGEQEVLNAQKERGIKTAELFPIIKGTGNIRHNIKIQQTPMPAKLIDPNAPWDEMTTVKMGSKWGSAVGLQADWTLFDPEVQGERQSAVYSIKEKMLDKAITINQKKQNALKAFAAFVVSNEQLTSTVADTISAYENYRYNKELFSKEKILKEELNKSYAALIDSKIRYDEAWKIERSAKAELLSSMGLRPTNQFIEALATDETLFSMITDRLNNYTGDKWQTYTKNKSLTIQKLDIEIDKAKHNIKIDKLSFLPKLSLNAYYGANFYSKDIDLGHRDKWYGNSFIALNVTLPLTGIYTNASKLSQSKTQEIIALLQYEKESNLRLNEIQKAVMEIQYRQKTYDSKKEAVTLYNENFNTAKLRYSKGYLLEKDLKNEEFKYKQSLADQMQAAYNLIVSLIDYQAAIQN
ncbi:TolC family protein [Porphyromonas pogonae]|uniref:TolC family protein n=1 Tax=Porphyromonas pogonae TaxID=867595 RepID=UPI002E78BF42|nr:TolC family protein [Porphyromonas pogonae]